MEDCACEAGIDLADGGTGHALNEMMLVANVFRHGEGRSLKALQSHAPHLWNYAPSRYVDVVSPNPDESEKLLLEPQDVARYARACFQFWGRADKQALAVLDVRYN